MTTAEHTGQAAPLTRADRADRVAFLEQLAEAAKAAAKEHRTALEDAARDEHQQGCLPSWRMTGVGLVSGRESNPRVDVTDAAALLAWVQQRHPSEIQAMVRPSFVEALCRLARPDGDDGQVVDDQGETIPGLTWRPGGRFAGIRFVVDAGAKDVYAAAAAAALARIQGIADAAEGAALLAGETPGELPPSDVG